MKCHPKLRNGLFRCRYLFRGYPASIGGVGMRVDESLRRWNFDAESEVTVVLKGHLRPGDTFVDVGANFGLHTLYAASLVGETGRVIAFEPIQGNVELLRKHVRLNGLQGRLIIHEAAVSNSSSPYVQMSVPNDGLAVTASITTGVAANGGVTVRNVRLDDLAWDGPQPIRMIKVDVEGAEEEVLRGAAKLLQMHHPLILVEVHGYALPAFGSGVAELKTFLGGLGYEETRLGEPINESRNHYEALYAQRTTVGTHV